jgi:hypothetical protein
MGDVKAVAVKLKRAVVYLNAEDRDFHAHSLAWLLGHVASGHPEGMWLRCQGVTCRGVVDPQEEYEAVCVGSRLLR